MDVTLPDGTVVKGIPDGTTKAQLATKLKSNGMTVPDSWMAPEKTRVQKYMDQVNAPAAPGEQPSFAGAIRDPIKEAQIRGVAAPSVAGQQSQNFEAGANMLSGIVAKPISDIAGLAATAYDAATGSDDPGRAADFKRATQNYFTYRPRHIEGALAADYNPLALIGKAIGGASEGTGGLIRGNAPGDSLRGFTGNTIQEGMQQAPGFIGVKGAPALRSAADTTAGALRSSAESMMQSALKPTMKQIKKGDSAFAIDTMLDQGIPLSKNGIESMREKINTLNDKIKDAIKSSTGTVKISDIEPLVKERLETVIKQANPEADIAATNKAWEEFKRHPLIAGKDEIPIQLAQELKQGTYKGLSKKYGEMGNADVETQKAIARGLKEGVAKNAPEVVEFNKEESRLLRTLPIVERRLLIDANKNPLGLSLLAHSPGTWAAFMLDKSAAFKAMTARILNAVGESVPFQTKKPAAPGISSGAPPGMPPRPPAAPSAPLAAPGSPPPIAPSIPAKFRTPAEKSRAIRDADKFNLPPGTNLREWYYSDKNPNNPLK